MGRVDGERQPRVRGTKIAVNPASIISRIMPVA